MSGTRPTILQIVPELDTGGAELSTVEIAAAIVRAGGRALVASQGGRLVADIERAGAKVIDLPMKSKNPLVMARNIGRLAELARREGARLLHARSRAPAWSALAAARRLEVPFVTTYHGAYNEGTVAKRLYNSVMARGDLVIANSGFTRDLIRQRYGTPAERIRVIYRGVDVHQFDPDRIEPARLQALRVAWGLEGGETVVLQAARLTGWKGQTDVIEAVRRLGVRPGLVVVLAGDAQGRDGYRADLERLIGAAGLDGAVRLVGHCADMPAAFALAHVAVVASREPEAFGRAAAEAQAASCPVIATDIGAPPETVRAAPAAAEGDITGWLVPPADPARLAGALEAALALGPKARSRIGARARAHVATGFTLEAMQRQTLEVYDALLGTELARAFNT